MSIDLIPIDELVKEKPVYKMQDLSKEQAINLLKSINVFRLKENVDEFIAEVLNEGNEINQLFSDKSFDELFKVFIDYVFINYDKANWFNQEPECKSHNLEYVFITYKHDVPPSEIKKLEDLTKNDAIRLLRMVNSFRSQLVVRDFFANIYVGYIIKSIYDTFSVFVERLFFEYNSANYFKDKPKLENRNVNSH